MPSKGKQVSVCFLVSRFVQSKNHSILSPKIGNKSFFSVSATIKGYQRYFLGSCMSSARHFKFWFVEETSLLI